MMFFKYLILLSFISNSDNNILPNKNFQGVDGVYNDGAYNDNSYNTNSYNDNSYNGDCIIYYSDQITRAIKTNVSLISNRIEKINSNFDIIDSKFNIKPKWVERPVLDRDMMKLDVCVDNPTLSLIRLYFCNFTTYNENIIGEFLTRWRIIKSKIVFFDKDGDSMIELKNYKNENCMFNDISLMQLHIGKLDYMIKYASINIFRNTFTNYNKFGDDDCTYDKTVIVTALRDLSEKISNSIVEIFEFYDKLSKQLTKLIKTFTK